MPLIDSAHIAYAYVSASQELMLFLGSVAFLFLGLLLKIWNDAHNLKFLEHSSLKNIEMTHPHLPSVRAIGIMTLSTLALLFVGLEAMHGIAPFNDPYQWLNLASVFILALACGILAELRWRGTRDYAFAFIAGTATAFLILAARSNLTFTLLTIGAIALSWAGLLRQWSTHVMMVGVLSFLFWILLHLLA